MVQIEINMCDDCKDRKAIVLCELCKKDLCKNCDSKEYICLIIESIGGYGSLNIHLCKNCLVDFNNRMRLDKTIEDEIIKPAITQLLIDIYKYIPKIRIVETLEKPMEEMKLGNNNTKQ